MATKERCIMLIPQFIRLFEANLEELFELENLNIIQNKLGCHYLQVMKSYLRGDCHTLAALHPIDTSAESEFINILIKVRHDILASKIQRNVVEQLNKYCEKDGLIDQFSYWLGEISFVVAMAYLELKDYENAKKYYRIAYREFDSIGAKKKAVKSLLNVLVAESRADNSKKLLIDYQFVAKKALSAHDSIVAGICYMNISREIQLIGSLNVSLKFINKSIECLQSDHGTTHYYSAILHRCHVLLELGRNFEARLDYEEASMSPYIHIKEAIKLLDLMFHKNKIKNSELQINTEKLDPTWRGRLKDFLHKKQYAKLSDLESTLIEYLLEKNRSKDELIELLYGKKIDYPAAENRFRVLMSRLRKRHPGLIVTDKNEFKIADEVFLTSEVS